MNDFKKILTSVIAVAMSVMFSVTAAAATVIPQKDDTVISMEVRNGGVEIVPVSSSSVRADYDGNYHEVLVKGENGEWKVQIRGKLDFMGEAPMVKLYVPDTGCKFYTDMDCGSLLYRLPKECPDTVNVTAKDSEITFLSDSQYQDSTISVTGEDRDYIKYSLLQYPDFFTESGSRVTYENGEGTNKIHVILTGFTSVNFAE